MQLWVVIPAFNEEQSIGATLTRLAAQTDQDFELVVVDNASTDRTAEIVRSFTGVHLIAETQKGTGAAADTGFRHAILNGATHIARTDADCLPDDGWIAAVRGAFEAGLEMISGPLRPRTDEFKLKLWERRLLPAVVALAAAFGRVRPGNRDAANLGPYVMMPGCNMAISAALYEKAGGFPRSRIEDLHEDRALVNRVRRLTRAYGLRKDMIVYGSVRRLRAYGLVGTLGWYADHRYTPEVVDVRLFGVFGEIFQEVVELAVLDALDEGVPLGLGEVENRAVGLLGILHHDGLLAGEEDLVVLANLIRDVFGRDELDDDAVFFVAIDLAALFGHEPQASRAGERPQCPAELGPGRRWRARAAFRSSP